MVPITENDLALFRDRAKTELKSTGDIGRLAWDDVVDALCKEVARLRSVSKERDDAAKLREALNLCVDEMCARCRDLAKARGNPAPCLNGCEPVRKAKAALAAPVKNCEVGTAEELADMRKEARSETYKDWQSVHQPRENLCRVRARY